MRKEAGVFGQILSRFVPGEDGPAGRTVCQGCGLPFSGPVLAPNLLVGKMVRCPSCATWGVRSKASRQELEQAEKRFRKRSAAYGQLETPARDLERKLEGSRDRDSLCLGWTHKNLKWIGRNWITIGVYLKSPLFHTQEGYV